jgi:hypothetical protein
MSRHFLIAIAISLALGSLAGCAQDSTNNDTGVAGGAESATETLSGQGDGDLGDGAEQSAASADTWFRIDDAVTPTEERDEPRPDPWHDVQRALIPKPFGRAPTPDDAQAPESVHEHTK